MIGVHLTYKIQTFNIHNAQKRAVEMMINKNQSYMCIKPRTRKHAKFTI